MALLPHTHTLSGGVEGGKTHTKVDSMMFSRVIYICNARKTSPNTKENSPHAFPRYPGKYLASASLSYSKSLVWSKTTKLVRERAREGGTKGGQVLPLEKLLAPDGPLDCLLGL